MFRLRCPLASPHPTLHLLIRRPSHATQFRFKTKKRLYKGERPRNPKPKNPPPAPKPEPKPEPKPIIQKKPRDPLQGMREANEKEKIFKYPPAETVAEKSTISKSDSTQVEKPVQETTPPSSQSTPESQAATMNKSAEVNSPPEMPVRRQIPPASPPPAYNHQHPHPNPRGDRKWMFYLTAFTIFGGGLYLFFGTPKDANAKKVNNEIKVAKPMNMEKAIMVLKDFFHERCSTDPDDLAEFGGQGIMNVGSGMHPKAVVWPENTEEVEIIMKIAEIYNVPVIPYSGGTSLEGQCVPVMDAITVSMERMNKVIALRPHDMDITLQPGISWNELNAFLKPYKLFFPVDPGPNAHIGGMIATSASGTNAVRYGTMKDWVLNLTVVLPGGHVMKTRSRARKSSTGYDLTRLFCGSEGTLGIITEVTLKLAHLPEKEVVGAIAFETNTAAANAVSKLIASGVEPRCIELLDTTCISVVNNSVSKSIPPFPMKPHLFFKLAGVASIVPQQQKQLTSVLRREGGSQLRIARTEQEGEQLWDIRKSLAYNLIAMFPGSEVISTDVCVPISRLPLLIEQYKQDQEKLNQEIAENAKGGQVKKLSSLILGHVGDGNFHSIIVFEKGNAEVKEKARELESSLIMNAIALDGTCSGEHGIGVHKIGFLAAEYDAAALTLMRAIKIGIDPRGLMNPGTLLPSQRQQEEIPRTTTIDVDSLTEWIVKPKKLDEPAEVEPQLHSVVEGTISMGESWYSRAWRDVEKLSGNIVRLVGWAETAPEAPKGLKDKEIPEALEDKGDEA